MIKKTRSLAVAVLLAGAVFGLSACGSTPATPPPAASSNPAAPAAASSNPAAQTSSAPVASAPSTPANDTQANDSSAAALQAIITAAEPSIASLKKSDASTYADIKLTAEGDNTLAYTFQFKKQLPQAAGKTALDTQKSTFQTTANTVLPAMASAGVTNPVVKFVFLNADGSTIESLSFK